MTHPPGRGPKALIIGVGVIMAVLVVLAAAGLVVDVQSRASARASARSDEIAACRSEYATAYDSATEDLHDAESRRDDLTLVALRASATDDEEAFQAAIDASDDALLEVATLRAERSRVGDIRSRAATLSRTDPAAFIAECRRRG